MTQGDLFGTTTPEPEGFEVNTAADYAGQDPAGLLMSEKLDGIRAKWNGHTLRTRKGNLINAPGWFLAQLPKGDVLDGELWAGRGRFQDVLSYTKATPITAEWFRFSGVRSRDP